MQKNPRVYIAAPFFTDKQLGVVMRIESVLLTNGIEFYSPRSEGIIKNITKEQKAKNASNIFKQNVLMLDEATHIIAVIDGYDTGTVWEMGYAYKAKKKIITYSDNYYNINVMLNESIIFHCINMLDIIPALTKEDFITEKPETMI